MNLKPYDIKTSKLSRQFSFKHTVSKKTMHVSLHRKSHLLKMSLSSRSEQNGPRLATNRVQHVALIMGGGDMGPAA